MPRRAPAAPVLPAAAAVLLLAACGGQGTTTTVIQPQPPETVTLRGAATLAGGLRADGVLVKVTGTSLSTTITAPDGTFAIPGVAAGIHSLELSLGDYEEVVPGVSATAAGTFIVGANYAPFGSVELPRAHRLSGAEAAGCSPVPSPDLARVAYCDGSNGDGTFRLAVQPLPKGTPVVVGQRVPAGQFVFTTDARGLFFMDLYSPLARWGTVSRLDVATGAVTRLVQGGPLLGLASDGLHVLHDDTTSPMIVPDGGNHTDALTLVHYFPAANVELRADPGRYASGLHLSTFARERVADAYQGWLAGGGETAFVLDGQALAGTFTLKRYVAATGAVGTVATGVRADLGGRDGRTVTATRGVFSTGGAGAARALWLLDLASGAAVQVATDAAAEQFTADGAALLVLEDSAAPSGPALRAYRASDGQLLGTLGERVRADGAFAVVGGAVAFVDQVDPATLAGRLVVADLSSCAGGACPVSVAGPVSAEAGQPSFLPGGAGVLLFDPYQPGLLQGTLKLHAAGALSTLGDGVPATAAGLPEHLASADGASFFFRRLVTAATGVSERACRATTAGLSSCEAVPTALLDPAGGAGLLFLRDVDPILQTGRLQLWRFGEAAPVELSSVPGTGPILAPSGRYALFFGSQPLDGSPPGPLYDVTIPASGPASGAPRPIAPTAYADSVRTHQGDQASYRIASGPSAGRLALYDLGGAGQERVFPWSAEAWWIAPDGARVFIRSGATLYAHRASAPSAASVVSNAVPTTFTFEASALFDLDQSHFVFRATGDGTTGPLLSVPTTIDPVTTFKNPTVILGRAASFSLWSDAARTRVILFAQRSGTPSPMSFQDGTYVATLP